jgi:hypothetical protein
LACPVAVDWGNPPSFSLGTVRSQHFIKEVPAAIMGADTPAPADKKKPEIKVEGEKQNARHGQQRGNNNARRDHVVKKEKFLGADPDLQGSVFESKRSRSEQVANFEKVDALIKDQVGKEYHPFVLESLEKEEIILPDEPNDSDFLDDKGNMSEINKIKFRERYHRHLNLKEKVTTELKQVYAKYYGQCDDDMKATLKEDAEFKNAHDTKDVLKLRIIMRRVTFQYRSSEDNPPSPI